MNKNDLSADQREAYSGILAWLNRGTQTKQTLCFAGYAGTGKTTVVSVLAHDLPQPIAFCAFTGKASSVLGRKLREHGIVTTSKQAGREYDPGLMPYCGTIHGLIYKPCDLCMPREEVHEHDLDGNCRAAKGETCELHEAPRGRCPECSRCSACDPPPPPKPRSSGRCGLCGNGRFLRRDRLDRPYEIIVCDEASMVSDEMLASMMNYGVPILAVGDHGQLKPVHGSGSLMKSPDIRLEKIHRQAEGNPIIALSKSIRETGYLDANLCDGAHVGMYEERRLFDFLAQSYKPGREDLLSMAVICWTNRTRSSINKRAREALGRGNMPPMKGDIVICLKNKPPIYNGMRGIITSDVVGEDDEKRPKFLAQVDFPEDGTMDGAAMSAHQFYAEKTIDWDRAVELGIAPLASVGDLYDYGYAMTCHKMQGSQSAKVAVVVERGLMNRPDSARWLYTAVTRSSDRLVIFR